MKRTILYFTLLSILLTSCTSFVETKTKEQLVTEIEGAETQFMEIVAAESMKKTYVYFTADDLTINRGDSLIVGKSEVADLASIWQSDHIDLSASADFVYTNGNYAHLFTDHIGDQKEYKAVWTQQANWEWKYVWD